MLTDNLYDTNQLVSLLICRLAPPHSLHETSYYIYCTLSLVYVYTLEFRHPAMAVHFNIISLRFHPSVNSSSVRKCIAIELFIRWINIVINITFVLSLYVARNISAARNVSADAETFRAEHLR